MRNHWITIRRRRQFTRVIEFLQNKFVQIGCQFSEIPGGEKIFVKQLSLHICTILRNRDGWHIAYYAGDRKTYKDDPLPNYASDPNDPFWHTIETCVGASVIASNKPETIEMK